MEWWVSLSMMLGLLLLMLTTGMPVAFAFMVTNFIGIVIFAGWGQLDMLVRNGVDLISSGSLTPIIPFTLMGLILSHSGVGWQIVEAIEKWIGGIPGRLSLLAILSGTIIGALSGVSMAVAAILCTTIAPAMMKRGYSNEMTIGPILVGSLIDNLIPPSSIAILMGVVAQVSIGRLLFGIVGPGLLLSLLCIIYIIVRAGMRPDLAPKYQVFIPVREKIVGLRHIVPVGFIFMAVMGLIFFGVATPSESAALGALSCFIVVAGYRKLTWDVCKKTMLDTVKICVMIYLIVMTASIYSNLLSYSGALPGATAALTAANIPKAVVLALMILAVLIMGTFTEAVSIMMVTMPVFMPVVHHYGIDPVWFCSLMIVAVAIGGITPPYGLILFVVQALLKEKGVTMGDVFRASIPYIAIAVFSLLILCVFPIIILWLPQLMRG